MLLRFSASNFLSIRGEAEVSFVATALKEHAQTLIPSKFSTHGVLPVIAIYGANAAGKSNVLFALRRFRAMVLNSFQHTDAVFQKPFLLDKESNQKASTFIADFVLHEVRYQLGLTILDKQVREEWLYYYPNLTKRVLYERGLSGPGEFRFGRALTGSLRQIQSITRPDSLFVSTAATSGHSLLTEVRDYFQTHFQLPKTSELPFGEMEHADLLDRDVELRRQVLGYLAGADTGITNLRVSREPISDAAKAQLSELGELLSKLSGGQLAPKSPEANVKIELGHNCADGEVRYLEIGDESLGTRYMLGLLPSMLTALRDGKLLVLDEITTSLHTLLAQKLVSMFTDRKINTKGAQLLFTTHDTNLLSPGILRRDEVWFAEKSSDGATTVYPLSDIKTKNTDNIERGYIQGRFGAIPYISPTLELRSDG